MGMSHFLGRFIDNSMGSSFFRPLRRSRHKRSQMKRLSKGKQFWFK